MFSSLNLNLKQFLAVVAILALAPPVTYAQLTCSSYSDIFLNPNKYAPQFELNSFTTPVIRVDKTYVSNLISFMVVDKDEAPISLVSAFTVTSNDSNFFVTSDLNNNKFIFNFKG